VRRLGVRDRSGTGNDLCKGRVDNLISAGQKCSLSQPDAPICREFGPNALQIAVK
jgi:hypothetical protein